MHLTAIDQSLWAATFAEDLVLIVVLLFRHRVRKYLFLTMLILLDVFRTVVLLVVQHYGTKATYFYMYWALALVDVMLQLNLVYRVAAHAFRPNGKWARDTVHGLVWLLVISLLVATVLTWIPNPRVVLRLQVVLLKGNFCSAILLSQLSVGVFALSVRAGLSSTAHMARIMQGYIAYVLCTVGLETARTYFGVTQGSHVYESLSHSRIVVYILCMTYWIVTLWREEPASREMSDPMLQQVSAISAALASKVRSLRMEVRP